MVTLTKATTYNEALSEPVEWIRENHRMVDSCFRNDFSGGSERWIQCYYVILGKAMDGRIVFRKALSQMAKMPANADPRGDAERCMAELKDKNIDTLADGNLVRFVECALYEVTARGANILTIHEYKE